MSLQSRNRERGKEAEKAIAKLLGGRRVGILGKEDIYHPDYTVEVKSRKAFAGSQFLEQAEKHNPGDKTALAIVHVTGKRYADDIVMMRLKDFLTMKEA
jgi:hypothetical protein